VCVYGTSGPWVYGALRSSDSIGSLRFGSYGTPLSSLAGKNNRGTCVFCESCVPLIAVFSAPLVMSLHDSDIHDPDSKECSNYVSK